MVSLPQRLGLLCGQQSQKKVISRTELRQRPLKASLSEYYRSMPIACSLDNCVPWTTVLKSTIPTCSCKVVGTCAFAYAQEILIFLAVQYLRKLTNNFHLVVHGPMKLMFRGWMAL